MTDLSPDATEALAALAAVATRQILQDGAREAVPDAERLIRYAETLAIADGWEWGPGRSSVPSSITERYHKAADAALGVADEEQRDLRLELAEVRHVAQQNFQVARELRAELEQAREVTRRLAAHAAGFQDVLDDSDRDPWARTVRADIAALRAVLDPTAAAHGGQAEDGAQPTAARLSYRLEHRRPGDPVWQRNTPGIGANWSWQSREKADQRLAVARDRWPDYEHRLVAITTTVIETVATEAGAQR
ncbi:hypothetical protein [Streptomyces sp. 4R-3d]|uniref:hypothetical protein n=1 Tax=Streptomyces sp. 4R-3d TaxID=2559605 RepID=UPI0010716401|nr:hypothetical protein [Streptomyces sp. 4R-3d]TFI30114.1 hypothetical protein E4P36_05025 [Streptomyces sp. 4R-3d]